MKQITKVGYSMKIGGKDYHQSVTLSDIINPRYTKKYIRKNISDILTEVMQILTESMVDSAQKIVTGKTESEVIMSKIDKEIKEIEEIKIKREAEVN